MPMKKPAVPISKDEDSDEESDDIGDESMSEDDDSEDVFSFYTFEILFSKPYF